ncbi:putative allatostatin B receptor [Daphnia sinensis]|uniref:Allatostatin B receptor n=1 Tax=Daphnia sinensis TaxID=1820382 RepID=A0AAD5KUD7_9CRUS|nr:putative allatostatin B receptor [Daphnia sinensis]
MTGLMAVLTNETTSTDLNQQLELENEKNLSTDYIAYDQRQETYIVPFLFSAIFLIGVVGNGCLIYIFCRHKSMRSLPNLYIFNLAVVDLLVLLCSVPFTATIYTFDSWPYGEFVCKASEFAKDMSVGVSVFTLTALNFERYTVIVKPVEAFVTNSNSKLSIVMCVALIGWLPSGWPYRLCCFHTCWYCTEKRFLKWNSFGTSTGHWWVRRIARSLCVIHFHQNLVLPTRRWSSLVDSYFITVCRFSSLEPFWLLKARLRWKMSHLNLNRNRESRIKVAKMYFVVLFAICFLLMHIFSLWFHFDPDSRKNFNNSWNVFRIFGFGLACTNSCINPVALYSASTNFRNHFNRLLCCCGDAEDSGSRETSGSLRPEYRRDNDHSLVEIPGQSTSPFEHTVSRLRTVCQSVDEMC